MAIKSDEYETLRAWSAKFIDRVLPLPANLPAEAHPIAVLDAMAEKWPARARQGLALMMGDFVEDTAHLAPDEVKRIDADFAQSGLPTLSDIRLRFMRQVKAILRRGTIRSDGEYYVIRNAVEGISEDTIREKLWQLLAGYEQKVST